MENENTVTVNRTFKSTVFIMLFEDRNNLLELYNAMTGKHYTDPELLEINTLENAIYMTMKNDVSFLIDGRLSLYEHQSTYNPNLPCVFCSIFPNLCRYNKGCQLNMGQRLCIFVFRSLLFSIMGKRRNRNGWF